ncbi:MAG TPA: peptidase M28 family protein, partial [Planctomycetota bacterium]|nr:peptidase M28 family protein [Planctomycetota bacterium]
MRKIWLVSLLIAGCAQAPRAPKEDVQQAAGGQSAAQDILRPGDGAYKKLVELCDDVGHRLSGSKGLERAVEWGVATMKADGHENVRAEPVKVPKWVRGKESLTLVEPRE